MESAKEKEELHSKAAQYRSILSWPNFHCLLITIPADNYPNVQNPNFTNSLTITAIARCDRALNGRKRSKMTVY